MQIIIVLQAWRRGGVAGVVFVFPFLLGPISPRVQSEIWRKLFPSSPDTHPHYLGGQTRQFYWTIQFILLYSIFYRKKVIIYQNSLIFTESTPKPIQSSIRNVRMEIKKMSPCKFFRWSVSPTRPLSSIPKNIGPQYFYGVWTPYKMTTRGAN